MKDHFDCREKGGAPKAGSPTKHRHLTKIQGWFFLHNDAWSKSAPRLGIQFETPRVRFTEARTLFMKEHLTNERNTPVSGQ